MGPKYWPDWSQDLSIQWWFFPLKFVWKRHGAPRAWRPCRPGTRWPTLLGSAGPGCSPFAAWPQCLPLI